MPGGDGTGPMGLGAGRGRGQGAGYGRGRMGGPYAAGAGGYCKCSGCGYIIPHSRAQPCTMKQCPKCGTPMTRA